MPSKFIEAVVRATGRKQRIPAAWLDHEVLGEPFRETSRARDARKATTKEVATPPAAPADGDSTIDAPPAGDKE